MITHSDFPIATDPTAQELAAARATISKLVQAVYRYAPDRSRPALEQLVKTAQDAQAQWYQADGQ